MSSLVFFPKSQANSKGFLCSDRGWELENPAKPVGDPSTQRRPTFGPELLE